MPQLRDSGNHGSWQEARRSSQFQGFARIFGVETEYGVSVTGSDHPVDAAQVAMMMFQPVVSRARSTNTYLTNGSRLYLDVGSHPEYATASPVPRATATPRPWPWRRLAPGPRRPKRLQPSEQIP